MLTTHPMTQRRIGMISAALAAKSMTVYELADAVFLCPAQVSRYCVHMRNIGLIHISAWPVRAAGNVSRIASYRNGARPDVPRGPKLTGAERQATRMARVRADMDAYDKHTARARARKVKARPDPLVAAFFGFAGAGASA